MNTGQMIVKSIRVFLFILCFYFISICGYSQTKQIEEWYDPLTKKIIAAKYSVLASNFELKHGAFKTYARTGAIISEGMFDNGVKVGKWIYRFDNNLVERICNYNQKGELHGAFIKYDWLNTNGKSEEGTYSNGLKTGPWKDYWCESGKPNVLEFEGSYLNDKEIGPWKFYYKNGKLEMTGNFIDGKKNGMWTFFEEGTGEKINEGNYLNGKRIGQWTLYYDQEWKETSTKSNRAFFRKIKFLESGDSDGKVTDYYITGEKQFEGSVLKGDVNDGDCFFFYKNGNVESEGKYDKENAVGLWKYYYESGKIKAEGNFKNDNKDGEWVIYHESGKIAVKETYKPNGTHFGTYYDESGSITNIHTYEGRDLDLVGIQEEEIKQLLSYIKSGVSKEKPFKFQYDVVVNQDPIQLFYGIERNASVDPAKFKIVKDNYDKYTSISNKDEKYKLGKTIVDNLYSLAKKE